MRQFEPPDGSFQRLDVTFASRRNSMLALSPELNVLALVAGILWLVVFAWLFSILLTLYGLLGDSPCCRLTTSR